MRVPALSIAGKNPKEDPHEAGQRVFLDYTHGETNLSIEVLWAISSRVKVPIKDRNEPFLTKCQEKGARRPLLIE